jgi:predicted nucleic acid-binding protein
MVVAKSCYLLRRMRTAAEVARIMRKYRDVPADLADACLIYAAGQLGVGEILTLDHDWTEVTDSNIELGT